MRSISIFAKFALSEVCWSVTQSLLKFQTIFGRIITNTHKKVRPKPNKLSKNIFLNLLSNRIKTNKQNTKYIAAYFDKKPNPRKIPNNIKFLKPCLLLILINSLSESVQNNNKKRSVLIIKDEKETAGINKKIKQPANESFLFSPELSKRL